MRERRMLFNSATVSTAPPSARSLGQAPSSRTEGHGTMGLSKSRVVLVRHTDKCTEAVRVIDAQVLKERDVGFQQLEVVWLSDVGEPVNIFKVLPGLLDHSGIDPDSQIPQGPSVAEQGGKVGTKGIGEVVDSLKHPSRFSKNVVSRVIQHALQQVPVLNENDWVIYLYGPSNRRAECRESGRKRRYLVQQQTTEYLGIRLLQSDAVIVLLLGYCLGVVSNLGSLLGCAICNGGYPDGARRGSESHNNRRPLGQVSQVRRKRTDLNRHTPSLLEPILP